MINRKESERKAGTGNLLASLLTGSWRDAPPVVEQSGEELARASSLLVGSGASGLCWWRIRNSELRSSPVAVQHQQAYRFQTVRAALHEREIKEVFALLRSAGIEPILIKGWATSRLYPEKGLRPTGDIDLFILPEQRQTAITALEAREGYRTDVDFQHDDLDTLGKRAVEELYVRSQTVRLEEAEIRLLGPEDHLRLLCMHLLRHGAYRPLWLCDIALEVESRPSDFDWDLCFGKDRRRADWVACTIALAHQLLGARVDNTPVENKAGNLPGWLIPTVLKQWEAPFATRHGENRHRAPMITYLRNPRGLLKDLGNRWPDPISATVSVNGSFNKTPRFFYQLGNCFSRIMGFISRLPGLMQADK